tara:strand:- start:3429 stop:5900 length:2472 start_codon:yes stop_codon:yes gene_type:complete
MPYTTENTYIGNGATDLYSFTFEYIRPTDIQVSLDGLITTEWALSNTTNVKFNTSPGAGVTIRIFRNTTIDNTKAAFFPGSAIRAQDLNSNFEQTLFVAQEIQGNTFRPDGSLPMTGNLDLGGFDVVNGGAQFNKTVDLDNNRITNLGSPEAATDAATRQYVDNTFTAAGDAEKVSTIRTRTVATQGQTIVTVNQSFYIGNELVFLNGVELSRNIEYTTPDDISVVFAEPLRAGDVVDVLAYNNIIRVDTSANFDSVPFSRNAFIATAGQSVFTCSEAFTVLQEQVFLNGSLLKRNVDYTTSNNTGVNLTVPALVGDLLEVHSGNYIATGVASLSASTYTYPGGVEQTVQTRLEQYVSVKDFGAVGDGVTDDTAAIQAALNSDTDKVILPYGQYLVNSNDLTVPINTTLAVIAAAAPDTTSRHTIASQTCLILGNNKTIILQNNAGLKGFSIIQEVTFRALEILPGGSTLTASDVANYSGTAIRANACVYVGYCNIFGFNQGLITDTTNTPRGRLEYLTFDCINGVTIDNDLGGWDLYSCHSYAVLTAGDANNIRSGIGFLFKNYSDWTYVTNCFSFNDTGFRIEDCNSIKFTSCGADHPRNPKGTVGFDIKGSSRDNLFIGCQTSSQAIGFRVQTSDDLKNMLTGCAIWSCDLGISQISGDLNVTGGVFRTITNVGIFINNASSSILVNACQFQDMPIAISTPAYLNVWSSHNEFMSDVGNVRTGETTKALTLTSGNLALPYNDTLLEINNGGITTLGTLIGSTRDPNSILILRFNDPLTLNYSATGMNLAGNVNASMTTGSTITLLYVSGNTWYELSRTIA